MEEEKMEEEEPCPPSLPSPSLPITPTLQGIGSSRH